MRVLGLGVRVRVLGLGVRGEVPIFWRAGEGQVRVRARVLLKLVRVRRAG